MRPPPVDSCNQPPAAESLELAFAAEPGTGGTARDFFLSSTGAVESRESSTAGLGRDAKCRSEFVNALSNPLPNPTTGRVRIAYTVASRSAARLAIYDVAGWLVRTLVDETQDLGIHEVTWDFRSTRGTRGAPGVYFCRLEIGSWRSDRKVLVLQR